MNKAIIMASDVNQYGDNISLMTMLAIASIRMQDKNIPIYCAVFTSRKLPLRTRKYLRLMKVNLEQVLDYRYLTSDMESDEAVFSRHLCCYHYGQKLLHKYDQLMYVDVDVLCLNPIQFTENKGIIIDTIPPSFLITDIAEGKYNEIESAMIDEGYDILDGKYHSMWITQVNKENLFIWETWFELFKKMNIFKNNYYTRAESILMNQIIHRSGIEVIDPIEINASIPTVDDGFEANHTWCHYDSFDESGYMYDVVNKCNDAQVAQIVFWLKAFQAKLPRTFAEQILKMKKKNFQKDFIGLLNGVQ